MRYNYLVLKIRKDQVNENYFNDNAMLFFNESNNKILGIIESNKDIINSAKLSKGFYKFDENKFFVDLKKLFSLKFQKGDDKFKIQKKENVETIPLKDFYKKVMFIKNKNREFSIIKKIEFNNKIYLVKFSGKTINGLNKFIEDNGNFITSSKYTSFKNIKDNIFIDNKLINKNYDIEIILNRLGLNKKEE